jgi:excisionase family DNA binding protein
MESLASADLAALVSDWLTWEQVADLLAVTPAKVKTMVKSHELAAARPGGSGSPAVPALFVDDEEGWVVKGLPGCSPSCTTAGTATTSASPGSSPTRTCRAARSTRCGRTAAPR